MSSKPQNNLSSEKYKSKNFSLNQNLNLNINQNQNQVHGIEVNEQNANNFINSVGSQKIEQK